MFSGNVSGILCARFFTLLKMIKAAELGNINEETVMLMHKNADV